MSKPKENTITLQLTLTSDHDYGDDPSDLIECIKENLHLEMDVELDKWELVEEDDILPRAGRDY